MWFLFLWNRYASNSLVINPDWPTNTQTNKYFQSFVHTGKEGIQPLFFSLSQHFRQLWLARSIIKFLYFHLDFRISLSLTMNRLFFLEFIRFDLGIFDRQLLKCPMRRRRYLWVGFLMTANMKTSRFYLNLWTIYITSNWECKYTRELWQLSPFPGTL